MAGITIGSLRCLPGRKLNGYLPVVSRLDSTLLGIPVMIVAGQLDGPVVLVDGAIHGDEQEGPLAIAAFARELDPLNMRGAFIGVPVMNVGALEAMARGNPRDTHSFDMNRIYPGRADGFLTDRIARAHHSEIGAVADMEITIHSGGNICYLAETIFVGRGDEKGLELARAMGPDWRIVLDTPRPSGSPMAAMLERTRTAITVELGGSAATMPGALQGVVEILKRSLRNVCRHYGMIDGTPLYADRLWRGQQKVVQASMSGLLEPNPSIPLKLPIRKDELLLRITDLFGAPAEELRSPCDGVLFGVRTYPSVTAGDWALFCADAVLRPAATS
ncbi:MAG: M14 family metallopeptidase [Acidobacteriota bacterium]